MSHDPYYRHPTASGSGVHHRQAYPRDHPQSPYSSKYYGLSYPTQPGPSHPYSSPNTYYAPQPDSTPRQNQGYYEPPRSNLGYGSASRGRQYLLDLATDVSNLNLGIHPSQQQEGLLVYVAPNSGTARFNISGNDGSPNYNKRLPPLPPPPISPTAQRHAPPSISDSNTPSDLDGPPPPYDAIYLPVVAEQCTPAQSSIPMQEAGPSRYTLSAPALPPRPISEPPVHTLSNITSAVQTPPKTFRPSVHPHSRPRLSEEAQLRPPSPRTPPRPHSDPVLRTSAEKNRRDQSSEATKSVDGAGKVKRKGKPKGKGKMTAHGEKAWTPIIDLTATSDSSSDTDSDLDLPSTTRMTPRSPGRRKRAVSEQPTRQGPSTPVRDRIRTKSPALSPAGKAVQCAGFTRTGQPCKRLVKVEAPFLALLASRNPNLPLGRAGERQEDEGDVRSERVLGRYCKDHAGMICQVGGFYWRSSSHKSGVWVDFDEFIPSGLGQHTQTLLRMTMESKLTPKELPGFLYAYELKDLETDRLAFFKVGRTDNVPRRIGQWTHQCQSKTPTLRDIFPLPPAHVPPSSFAAGTASNLHRSGTVTTSFLPGATVHRNPPSLAMKRWERLVHIELSERCVSHPESKTAFEKVREKCKDCGLNHREIFPMIKRSNGGKDVYEDVVEVVGRWERFVKRICEGD